MEDDKQINQPTSPFVDGMFHCMDRARIAELKAMVLAGVANLFDSIEYGEDGHALNQVSIDSGREFESLPSPAGRMCNIPKTVSIKISVGTTAARFKAALDKAIAGEPPYNPPAQVAPNEPTPAENLDPAFRAIWREKAKRMYTAYGDSVNWTSVSGQPMPRFDDVGPRVEGAWCVAADAAFSTAFGAALEK